MVYNLYDIIAPFLPFLAILFSALFNYYVIIKKRLSWQGILIANLVFLSVMTLFDFPAYDFLSEIVIFILDLIYKVLEALFEGLWKIVENIFEGTGSIIIEIWDWLKGIFS